MKIDTRHAITRKLFCLLYRLSQGLIWPRGQPWLFYLKVENMSSDSEDEDFAEYGIPLDPLNEGTINKRLKMHQLNLVETCGIG